MKRYITIILMIALSVLLPVNAGAQFYVTGDNPGRLKWSMIDTDNFRIIYPEGNDSLAKVYGYKLEKYRIPVSRSTGYLNKGRMPVVMHAYNAANGSVAWAPQRMDLFTIPSPYSPEPLPWSTMLSVHEGRHVTQMQFGMTKAQRPFSWLFGEMWNILTAIAYQGMANIEGDAVIAETALTNSGRGRTADFLNYYHVAFDNDDFRKWHIWRFMPQRGYSPDHYALGYLTLGGFRYLYNHPTYMNDLYDLASARPYNLRSRYSVTEKVTGKKYNDAFQEVSQRMHGIWKAEADARAPFIPMEPVTEEPRLYADYKGTVVLDGIIYSIKSGHETAPVLVSIDAAGNEKLLSRFAIQTGKLKASRTLDRLYWSESSSDGRWDLESRSKIRYMSLSDKGKGSLTGPDRMLHNPDINPDSHFIATVEYFANGRSSLTVVNGVNGTLITSVSGPQGVQLVETAWIGDDLYATGLDDDGYGIYSWSEDAWKTVLAPQPVMIKDFQTRGEELMFTSDRTGVNELYHFDPSTGTLRQKTVTRYGASDFAYDDDGKYLYYSSQTLKGMKMFRTAVEDLIDREADFTQKHEWILAEELARQEKELALKDGFDEVVPDIEVSFSEPRRYHKFPHMFNVHSWTPFYVSVDNIMNMSFDRTWQAVSLGAAAIMQNRLSNAYGEFGYSAHKDPLDAASWRHSGHARFTYSGLYPVIEASVDFNDRAALQYNPYYYINGSSSSVSLTGRPLSVPYVEGNLSLYIPWSFSSGGWYSGLVPKVSYRISNDKFNTSMSVLELQDDFYSFMYDTGGKNLFRHSLTGSLRAYTMLSTPNSAVYPRWGIGIEAGISSGLESTQYISPMGYGYAYGYVPGIIPTHGIRLAALHQIKLSDAIFGQPVVNVMPRGLSNNSQLLSWLSYRYENMTKLTIDYAFPICIGDFSIGGTFFSAKRLVMTPHFDYTMVGGYGLFSVGTELALTMNSILSFAWPFSFGVTYSYNGGSGFNAFAQQSGYAMGRHFVGPVFNVSF